MSTQLSMFRIKRKGSLKYILKGNGPSNEPCGT